MRVAFDVSPLSHAARGNRQLHARRIARSASKTAPTWWPSRRFPCRAAATSSRRSPESTSRRRLLVLPLAHAWRTAWSRLGRPATERWLGGFDVLHFSDWMFPPQRGGVRATTIHDLVPLRFPEWTHGRTVRMHGAKYRHAAQTANVLVCNSEFTARDVRELLHVPAERVRVAHPAAAPVFTREGERADLGQPVRAHGRDPRAAEEPRDAARRARAARRGAGARRCRRRRVGAATTCSTGRE